MKKIELKYCKSSYVDKIYRELCISQDYSEYLNPSAALESDYCGTTGIEIPDFFKLDPKDSDLENSIKLYSVLSTLTEVEASDERLWVYLTHVTFRDYMLERWPAEKAKSPVNRIKDRFFLRSLSLRGLTRNGISRLWWYAHLTIGREFNDDSLLKTMLTRADLAVAITERALGSHENTRLALLEFLKENPEITNSEQATRDLMVSLNLLGGVKLLPFMSKEEVLTHLKNIA